METVGRDTRRWSIALLHSGSIAAEELGKDSSPRFRPRRLLKFTQTPARTINYYIPLPYEELSSPIMFILIKPPWSIKSVSPWGHYRKIYGATTGKLKFPVVAPGTVHYLSDIRISERLVMYSPWWPFQEHTISSSVVLLHSTAVHLSLPIKSSVLKNIT
jgi:hypothetical protein